MNPANENLLSAVQAQLPDPLPSRLGVAVSGGSDSTALLHLLVAISRDAGITLFAATVDHGLRPEAADEAASVAALCAELGVSHVTLKWLGWDRSGNLQDQARRARYDLLRNWAIGQNIPVIALGHTADDQAETVLMRLGRSAGVKGLSAMAPNRGFDGVDLWRPLLFATRAQLRNYLVAEGIGWIDDPSNQDRRFDRVKARQALAQLAELGITADSLARVASNLGHANRALDRYAQESARKVAQEQAGSVRVDRIGFAALPEEIRRRLVVGIVARISGEGYPPRQNKVDQVIQAVTKGKSTTIGGCRVAPQGDCSWFCRELNAVVGQVSLPGAPWDGRWIAVGPDTRDAQVRVLGEEGLRQVPDWRLVGAPRVALLATPAIWVGDDLLAAPFAGLGAGWHFGTDPRLPEFYASFLSH